MHAVSTSLNIGPADSPEGSCELVKWCQASQQW